MPINRRFFTPKFVDIEIGLLELFENVTGVRFFRHSVYSQGNETLISCCLLTYFFAQQEYNRNERKHDGHVVYVIEQTDQVQKFGKTLA